MTITIIAVIGMISCTCIGYMVGRITGEMYAMDKLSHEIHDGEKTMLKCTVCGKNYKVSLRGKSV